MDIRQLAARQDGLVTVTQLAAAGVGPEHVRRRVRSGEWQRARRGVYLVDPDRSPADLVVQCRAVVLDVPGVVLAGSTAARAWGITAVADGPVEVVLPRRRTLRTRPDLVTHQWALAPGDVARWRGMPITTGARSLLDVVRAGDRLDAIAVLDEALRRGVATPAGLLELRDRARGMAGSVLVEDLWALADGRAESTLESRVRLRCIEGDLPPDDLQVVVLDEEGFPIARGDLCYRQRRRPGRGPLLVEADGRAVHGSADAVHYDRTRANRLVGRDHDMLRFVWRDTCDAATIPGAVRYAL